MAATTVVKGGNCAVDGAATLEVVRRRWAAEVGRFGGENGSGKNGIYRNSFD
jgi:hypothetical protein